MLELGQPIMVGRGLGLGQPGCRGFASVHGFRGVKALPGVSQPRQSRSSSSMAKRNVRPPSRGSSPPASTYAPSEPKAPALERWTGGPELNRTRRASGSVSPAPSFYLRQRPLSGHCGGGLAGAIGQGRRRRRRYPGVCEFNPRRDERPGGRYRASVYRISKYLYQNVA